MIAIKLMDCNYILELMDEPSDELHYETAEGSAYGPANKPAKVRAARIVEVKGSSSRIRIPDELEYEDGIVIIKAIGKKAFMGMKTLKEISLPATVELLEDWAFAQCIHLTHVDIRQDVAEDGSKAKDISVAKTPGTPQVNFERGVFDGCSNIESICLGYEETDDKALLLGAAAYRLPAIYLLTDPDIGSIDWFDKWDKSLLYYLNTPDSEGGSDSVLCGEEDISYDGIGSVDGEILADGRDYIQETVMSKCYLCFLRLKACDHLAEKYKEIFINYLSQRGKGMGSEAAWKVLKDSFGEQIEYFKLAHECGLLEVERIDDMLVDMGEQHAESKAFLIGIKQESSAEHDFFADLLL